VNSNSLCANYEYTFSGRDISVAIVIIYPEDCDERHLPGFFASLVQLAGSANYQSCECGCIENNISSSDQRTCNDIQVKITKHTYNVCNMPLPVVSVSFVVVIGTSLAQFRGEAVKTRKKLFD